MMERVTSGTAGQRWAVFAMLAVGVTAGFVAQIGLIIAATGGHFVYTLDDPYIHLALAEQISQGHYGINPYEASSPASSVLWPFLLAPTAWLSWQEWVPLGVNLAATVAATGVLLFMFRRVARLAVAALLTVLAVLGLNLVGIAFTGMEHSVQVLVALVVGYGVALVVQGQMPARWLLVAMAVGPLIRYENAAVSVAAAVVLFAAGYRRAAVLVTAIWVASLAGFSLFLVALGLDPLPSSILAKTDYAIAASLTDGLSYKVLHALEQPAILLCLLVLGADIVLRRRWVLMHTFVALALGAHVVAGDFGVLGRYEVYLLAAVLPPLVSLVADWSALWRLGGRALIVCSGVAALLFLSPLGRFTFETTASAESIYGQQAQTARFVESFWGRPVAVNDLGLVAYRTDVPVLDLWGLASRDARVARHVGSSGWMDGVTPAGVGLAAIYTGWFRGHVPETWVRVAELTGPEHLAQPSHRVDFYATDPEGRPAVCDAFATFSPTGDADLTTYC